MPRQERERRFIAEYMLATFPGGDWELNVPLGNVPIELVQQMGMDQARRMFRPSRHRVDAVAWTPDRYYIIESKIRDPREGMGQLVLYLLEAGDTPDLPGFTGQELIPRLVVPFSIPRDQEVAQKLGLELVTFWQDWIAGYIKERQLYFTAEYRAARDGILRSRELLGLE